MARPKETESIAETEHAGRGCGERTDGNLGSDARLDDGAQGYVECDGRTCEDPVVEAESAPSVYLNVDVAESIVTVSAARSRHCIGDERSALWCGVEDELQQAWVYVNAIGNELEHDAFISEGRHHGARCSVMYRGHRIEGVCEQSGATLEGSSGALEVGFGVTNRNDDASIEELFDRLVGAG